MNDCEPIGITTMMRLLRRTFVRSVIPIINSFSQRRGDAKRETQSRTAGLRLSAVARIKLFD